VITKKLSDQITGKNYTFSYTYEGASMNNEIGFGDFNQPLYKFYDHPFTVYRGHKKVTETGPDQRKRITEYYQLSKDQATYAQLYLTGTPKLMTITDGASGKKQSETAYDYGYEAWFSYDPTFMVDLRIHWNRLASEENKIYNAAGNYVGGTKKYYYYDPKRQGEGQYGNLTNVVESYWTGSTWQDYRLHYWVFYPNNNGSVYLTGLPGSYNTYTCVNKTNGSCYTMGQSAPPAAEILTSFLYIYDNNTQHSAMPTGGILRGNRTLLYWLNPSTAQYGDVKYEYDNWGNRTKVLVYPNYSGLGSYGSGGTALETRACYGTYGGSPTSPTCSDDGYGTFQSWERNALNHPATIWYYDKRLGVMTKEVDPNGVETTASYDKFGRMLTLIKAGDSSSFPTVQFSYCDSCTPYRVIKTQRIEAGSNNPINKTRYYYDGLGRLVQTHTANATLAKPDGSGVESRDLVVDYEYDAYGRVIKQTVPYDTNVGNDDYKGQSLNFQPVTSTSYDVLGRPLQVIGTDGLVQRSMTYDGLTTTLRDSKNQATTQTVDVWGLRPWSGRQPARRRSTATTGSTG